MHSAVASIDRPRSIATCIQTAAPRRRVRSAAGARVRLDDGREYLDLMNGKGCVTLGHNHPVVNEAIARQLRTGAGCATCWSDLHEIVADHILSDVALKDSQLAFFSTGTEAVRAAVEIARAASERWFVASSGYHGWGELWGRSEGLLEPNRCGVIDFFFMPELLEELLQRHHGQLALVILSPDYVHLEGETLRRIVDLARRHGVLVCCDDVKQGYRTAPASVLPRMVGTNADLYTFAKGLANGHRLSCVVGRGDLMAHAAELTYTAYLDTIPLAAAAATLKHMREENGYARLITAGAALTSRLRAVVAERALHIAVYGDGPLFQFATASASLDAAFYAACADAGLLLYAGDNQAMSLAACDAVEEIEGRFCDALGLLAPEAREDMAAQPVGLRRRFAAAFAMMDGATDRVSTEQALAWIGSEL